MNSSTTELNDPELDIVEFTVSEYSKETGIPENTVRTRINRKKLRTKWGERDGKRTLLIQVPGHLINSLNDPDDEDEQLGIVHELFNESLSNSSSSSGELLNFMERTFQTVQSYSSQIIELSRENERYKLISENSSHTLKQIEQSTEQLKEEIYQRDAKIRELGLKESSEPLLKAKIETLEERIKALEAQNNTLKEKNADLESVNFTLKKELAEYKELVIEKDSSLESLKNDLSVERNKSALDKLFKR